MVDDTASIKDREERRPTTAEQEYNREVVLEHEDNLLLLDPELVGYSLIRGIWSRLFPFDHA